MTAPAPWPDPAGLPPPGYAGTVPPTPADDNFAGAPYPDETIDQLRAPTGTEPGGVRAPLGIAPGQLVENIPRAMRLALAHSVEVRIAREVVGNVASGMPGTVTAALIMVTRSMSVRLRSPDGAFHIETISPETQWIDNRLGLMVDDYASWRWTVTPRRRGTAELQLVVSARTVGDDGVVAETALPDQVVAVSVKVNWPLTLRRWGGWAGAMLAGGIIGKLGEGGLAAGVSALRQAMGL
ncbi:MAG TPA: hypothetical protein PK264_02455 [Hyphomicrobiaceae bacterium]|nr:hypothetical protein [Hyphomicrobiaceae bacterium]